MTFNFTAQEIEQIARESPTFLAIVCRKLVQSESIGITERLKTCLEQDQKTTKISQVIGHEWTEKEAKNKLISLTNR